MGGYTGGYKVSFQRVEIQARQVKDAIKVALGKAIVTDDGTVKDVVNGDGVDERGIDIWADTDQHYLQIRRRGGSVRWMVRVKRTHIVIGDVRERRPDYLSVKAAREKAVAAYSRERYGKAVAPVSADQIWTFGRVCVGYQRMLALPRWINNREKPPSEGTNDDVQRAFAQASYQHLGRVNVLELTRALLNAARNGVSSYRQRQKCVAYVKAALTWAADKHPDESGLTEDVDRWWEHLTAGDPDPETMRAITIRRATHRQQKKDLNVEAIAKTLKAHEQYCAGRTAEKTISPGIRWGLWWVALTATRRLSAVRLLNDDLKEFDPEGAEPGWGVARWPDDSMKAKTEFVLPIPPIVYGIGAGSIADYTQIVANKHGDWPSKWVFASTRRHGRDADNDDVGVYPNSLNRHLQRMRAAGALDGIPLFNPHLVRSPVADLIEDRVSGAAASLVLAHTLRGERDGASATTRDSYLTTHRIREKTEGMKAWTGDLIDAYLRLDGKLPMPTAEPRKQKARR